MMVVRGNVTGMADGGIYPADRCSWTQLPNTNGIGYQIGNARFYPGFTAIGPATEPTGPADLSYAIVNAELGFIGKSGRFVGIAD